MKSRALIDIVCRRPDKVDRRDLPTAGPRQQAMEDGPPPPYIQLILLYGLSQLYTYSIYYDVSNV